MEKGEKESAAEKEQKNQTEDKINTHSSNKTMVNRSYALVMEMEMCTLDDDDDDDGNENVRWFVRSCVYAWD